MNEKKGDTTEKLKQTVETLSKQVTTQQKKDELGREQKIYKALISTLVSTVIFGAFLFYLRSMARKSFAKEEYSTIMAMIPFRDKLLPGLSFATYTCIVIAFFVLIIIVFKKYKIYSKYIKKEAQLTNKNDQSNNNKNT